MDPATILAIASKVPTLMQSILGLGKTVFGIRQMKKAKRPQDIRYEIPAAFREYLSRTDMLARQGLPGEDIMRGQIGSQVAGAVGDVSRAADSSVGALGAMTDIYGRGIEASRDLAVRGAEYRAQMQQAAAGARKDEAMYEDKAWEYNVNIPYQRKMHEYWGQKQSGMQNIWGGLDTMASAAVSGVTSWQQNQQMDSLISSIRGGGVDSGGTFSPPAYNIFNPPKRNIFGK